MISGAFKSMHHQHEFEEVDNRTLMRDKFEFEAPLGLLGTVVDKLILSGYMHRFLETRNARLKVLAEGDDWQQYLPQSVDTL